ncbi:MAG: porin [Methyloprofundus sp.]|nr:porin [Methyloprofundus sp.]
MKLKNTLLLSALAGVMAAPTAMAEDSHQVYGQVNISMDSTSVSGDGLSQAQKDGSAAVVGRNAGMGFKSNASRFGLKGKMDTNLADFKLQYHAEMEYVVVGDADASNVYGREATVGLNSKTKGFLRMGRLTTLYKANYAAMDPWTDHVLQARASGQQGASNLNANYFNNAIEYRSPRMSGFQVGAFYSVMHDGSTQQMHNAGKLAGYIGGSASGAGINYVQSGLKLALDTITLDADTVGGGASNGTALKFTAEYKLNSDLTLGGHYEDTSDLYLGTNIFAVASYQVGNALFTLSGGLNQVDSDSTKNAYNDEDATTLNVGTKYKLNKNASLIAGYSTFTRDNVTANTVTVGIDSKFGY